MNMMDNHISKMEILFGNMCSAIAMNLVMVDKNKIQENKSTIMYYLLGVITECHLKEMYSTYKIQEQITLEEAIDQWSHALQMDPNSQEAKFIEPFHKAFYKLQKKLLVKTISFSSPLPFKDDLELSFSVNEIDSAINSINNNSLSNRQLNSFLSGAMFADSLQDPNIEPEQRGLPGIFVHIDMVNEVERIYTKETEDEWKRKLQIGNYRTTGFSSSNSGCLVPILISLSFLSLFLVITL
jgi:hypothetical protein